MEVNIHGLPSWGLDVGLISYDVELNSLKARPWRSHGMNVGRSAIEKEDNVIFKAL